MSKPVGHGGQDLPDWGISPLSTKYPVLKDLSELAVRLGSPVSFDRMGTVVYAETFSQGMARWYEDHAFGTSDIDLWGTAFYTEPYCARFFVDDVAGATVSLMTYVPYAYLSRMGVEFAFAAQTTFEELVLRIRVFDGTNVYTGEIDLNSSNYVLNYRNSSNGWSLLASPNLFFGLISSWHIMKVVIDAENETYLRLSLDETDYDMSDYALYKTASSTRPHLEVKIALNGDGGNERTVFIDNIIITIDEPY